MTTTTIPATASSARAATSHAAVGRMVVGGFFLTWLAQRDHHTARSTP